MNRWRGGLATLVLAAATAAAAADPVVDPQAFDKLVDGSLRKVHDHGADLYNTKKDFAAAYRVYDGALRTVRPLLDHRPKAQERIDVGLAAAEKETEAAKQAFVLHETIEDVRTILKTPLASPKKPAEVVPKKPDPAPVTKPEPPPEKKAVPPVTKKAEPPVDPDRIAPPPRKKGAAKPPSPA